MVATDAVGMGLNLNVRRIVFYSIHKVQLTAEGDKEVDLISVSQALQIAGRAGRYGTAWETGYVTTFKQEDLKQMTELLKLTPGEILQAGAAELELLVEPGRLLPAVVEPHQVAVRRQELVLPHLLQLPHSVTRTLVHLPGNLHRIQTVVFPELDPVHSP